MIFDAKGLPKSTRIASRSALKATLEASLFQVSKKAATRLRKITKRRAREIDFGAILAPLGRFWAPFWPQLGAKGVPKSSIWASRRAQSRKNSFQEEV